jgi:hypothetical protein
VISIAKKRSRTPTYEHKNNNLNMEFIGYIGCVDGALAGLDWWRGVYIDSAHFGVSVSGRCCVGNRVFVVYCRVDVLGGVI